MFQNRISFRKVFICLGFALICVQANPADAQRFGGGRFGKRLGDQIGQRMQRPTEGIVAASGSPFGVGRITIQLPAGDGEGGSLLSPTIPTLTEKNGRVLYQAAASTPVRAVLRELLNRPQMATVYFLFTGDQPLELTLYGPSGIERQVTPQADADLRNRLLTEWWREYTSTASRANRNNEYPHLVDVYLTSMLARRLSLPPADIMRRPLLDLLSPKQPDLGQTVGLALGTESTRLKIEKATLASDSAAEEADQPLPQPLDIGRLDLPEPPANVVIEPMAQHVPEECLYLRFGTFNNYRWFRSTLDPWGGDLRNLIALRGLDYGINGRIERQISQKESELAKLFGPTVIADMALIGDDPFLREGAAIGMLYQARIGAALASDINGQRAETLNRVKDATDKKVTIAGHEVSFLSTPDNRVRSFYAVDGDFHLVTTSRRMVERFYEAGQGKDSLAKARDFRNARATMPMGGDDSLFVYLSEAFFRQLASPHYQIEMSRRLKSITDIELAEMARWAARAEGKPADTIEQLIAADLLPKGFAARADGSHLELRPDGLAVDSLRGAHGTFLPVPDVEVNKITISEVAAYERFVQSFPTIGGTIGPAMINVRHSPQQQTDREHVVLDMRMIPLVPKNDGLVQKLFGPPSQQRVAPRAGDVVSLELITGGGALGGSSGLLGSVAGLFGLQSPGGGGNAQPYHLFGGVRNNETALGARDSQQLQSEVLPGEPMVGELLPPPPGAAPEVPALPTPAAAAPILGGGGTNGVRLYFGAWPVPGLLQSLGLAGPGIPTDAEGYGQSKGGFWSRQVGDFTVASRQRDVLADVTSDLRTIDAPRPAQAWLHVGDVSDSKLVRLANTVGYLRARHVASGNAHFLHSLVTQLGVPSDKAREVAERLLNARLVSPVGGGYELQTRDGRYPTWAATGLPKQQSGGGLLAGLSPPEGFQTPPLDWFRGLDLDFSSVAGSLSGHAEIDMQRPNIESIATPTATPPVKTPPPPVPAPDLRPELKSVLKPKRPP